MRIVATVVRRLRNADRRRRESVALAARSRRSEDEAEAISVDFGLPSSSMLRHADNGLLRLSDERVAGLRKV